MRIEIDPVVAAVPAARQQRQAIRRPLQKTNVRLPGREVDWAATAPALASVTAWAA